MNWEYRNWVPWTTIIVVVVIALFLNSNGLKDSNPFNWNASKHASNQTSATAPALLSDPRVAQTQKDVQSGKITVDQAVSQLKALGLTDQQVLTIGVKAVGNGTVTQSTPTCTIKDFETKQGQEYDVPAGCVIMGDVSVLENGTFVKKYEDPGTGTVGHIVNCLQNCHIRSDYVADVGPNTVDQNTTYLKASGCLNNKGCADVKVFTEGTPTQATTASASATCEPEIKLGDKRVVAAGCVVVGDVFVRQVGSSQDFKPVFDNLKDTGTVQQLTQPMEVWNLQGASVMPAGSDLSSAVQATKIAGCGTGYGCPAGIFDWSGNRLDK